MSEREYRGNGKVAIRAVLLIGFAFLVEKFVKETMQTK